MSILLYPRERLAENRPLVLIGAATTIPPDRSTDTRKHSTRTKVEPDERAGIDDRFRQSFECAASGKGIGTPEGRWLEVNRALCEFVGRTREELLASSFADITHPDDVATDLDFIRRIHAGEIQSYESEKRYIHKDGHVVWGHLSVSVVYDEQGTPLYFVSETQDITDRKRREEQLKFQAGLLDAVGEALIATTPSGVVTYWNQGAERVYGWQADEAIGRHVIDVLPTALPPGEAHGELDRIVHGESRQQDLLIQRKDGAMIPVLAHATRVVDQSNAVVGIIGVSSDLSLLRHAERASRQSEERHRSLVETSPDGIAIVDVNGDRTFANQALANMLGMASPADVLSAPPFAFVAPEDLELIESEFRSVLQKGTASDIRVRLVRHNGATFPVQINSRLLHDEDGAPLGITTILRDISEQVAYEAKLQHLALHDALTGLPNSALLLDRLRHALDTAHRQDTRLALLYMDLDHFKEINDTYGHASGDHVLQTVASRMEATLRKSDSIARLGGDEFAVLLPETDLLGAIEAATKLVASLELSIDWSNGHFHIGTSIGIALSPDHDSTAEGLLRRADVAMYTAKRTNSGYVVYALEHDTHSPLRLVLINEIREAIETERLILHFQPKLHLSTGQIEGVEALVRWQHPIHGIIPPDQFIALAEHSGLIQPLTIWVLLQSLQQCRRWQDLGFDLGVAVNLSTRSLHDPRLPRRLAEYLQDTGVSAPSLTVEITESVIMAEPEAALDVLRRLKDQGIRISIDDFGTGYSSLSYLRELQADEIKIDKSFVLDLDTAADQGFIVRAVTELGHNLGLEVVAEGVENQSVLDVLAAIRCDWAQGYHLSRPEPAEDFVHWLRAQTHVRRLGQ